MRTGVTLLHALGSSNSNVTLITLLLLRHRQQRADANDTFLVLITRAVIIELQCREILIAAADFITRERVEDSLQRAEVVMRVRLFQLDVYDFIASFHIVSECKVTHSCRNRQDLCISLGYCGNRAGLMLLVFQS